MNAHIDAWLDAYLDGELSPARRATLATHLTGCDTCRQALDSRRALSARLQEWPAVTGLAMAPEQARRVRMQLGEPKRPSTLQTMRQAAGSRRHWGWVALPLALLVVLAFWITVSMVTPLLAVLPGSQAALKGLLPEMDSVPVPHPLGAVLEIDWRMLALPAAARLGSPILLAALALLYLAWLSSLYVREQAEKSYQPSGFSSQREADS